MTSILSIVELKFTTRKKLHARSKKKYKENYELKECLVWNPRLLHIALQNLTESESE
jgi:hypothetical protein